MCSFFFSGKVNRGAACVRGRDPEATVRAFTNFDAVIHQQRTRGGKIFYFEADAGRARQRGCGGALRAGCPRVRRGDPHVSVRQRDAPLSRRDLTGGPGEERGVFIRRRARVRHTQEYVT
jgi:hypothetical protein